MEKRSISDGGEKRKGERKVVKEGEEGYRWEGGGRKIGGRRRAEKGEKGGRGIEV